MGVKRAKPGKKIALSAGVIPIRRDSQEDRCLILRVYNYWDFPKGLVVPGEAPLDAALRELWEETSLNDVRFRWGTDFRETEPYSYGKVARYYVAEVLAGEATLQANPALGKAEHHEFRWCGFDEARELISPRVKPILDWARALVAQIK